MPETPIVDAGDGATTRLVIHADDVGMNHGANRAFVEPSRFGTVTAGSVIVPCPWFSEIAEAAAADDRLDCGRLGHRVGAPGCRCPGVPVESACHRRAVPDGGAGA